mmetsp:Transcript_94437/g.177798  ORF Transcript_94437/g.177798 Transcript_94437/m.177798 type:complete len:232 (+) Transcript_94437:3-698(+)
MMTMMMMVSLLLLCPRLTASELGHGSQPILPELVDDRCFLEPVASHVCWVILLSSCLLSSLASGNGGWQIGARTRRSAPRGPCPSSDWRAAGPAAAVALSGRFVPIWPLCWLESAHASVIGPFRWLLESYSTFRFPFSRLGYSSCWRTQHHHQELASQNLALEQLVVCFDSSRIAQIYSPSPANVNWSLGRRSAAPSTGLAPRTRLLRERRLPRFCSQAWRQLPQVHYANS